MNAYIATIIFKLMYWEQRHEDIFMFVDHCVQTVEQRGQQPMTLPPSQGSGSRSSSSSNGSVPTQPAPAYGADDLARDLEAFKMQ